MKKLIFFILFTVFISINLYAAPVTLTNGIFSFNWDSCATAQLTNSTQTPCMVVANLFTSAPPYSNSNGKYSEIGPYGRNGTQAFRHWHGTAGYGDMSPFLTFDLPQRDESWYRVSMRRGPSPTDPPGSTACKRIYYMGGSATVWGFNMGNGMAGVPNAPTWIATNAYAYPGPGKNYRGVWSSSTAYSIDDAVQYSYPNYPGGTFVALQASTNKAPNTNPTYWVHAPYGYAPIIQGGNAITEPGYGWWLYGDQQFHTLEVYEYFSAGTFRVWVDENLILDIRGLTGAASQTGMRMPENCSMMSSNPYPINWDFDDIAYADNTYTGFKTDAYGNQMIGAPSGGGSQPGVYNDYLYFTAKSFHEIRGGGASIGVGVR